jgi:hypothetical protein
LGIKSTDLGEANDTLRSLLLGCLALGRLIGVHEIHSSIPLPDDLAGVNYYDENCDPAEYMDPSFKGIEAKLKSLDFQIKSKFGDKWNPDQD